MLLPMWWLMLLPVYNGWCFYHMWQMDWPLLCDGLMLLPCGRWYSHLVGMWVDVICLSGRWNDHWVNYFNLSSLLLLRASSHMWGRWYLPMFLFRDGPLTLMYMDSLISLERFCSSLPTMLKFSSVVVWPEMLLWSWMGKGAFRCSLNLFQKCSWCFTNVLLITFQPITFKSVNNPTLFLLYDLCPLEPPIHLSMSFHS